MNTATIIMARLQAFIGRNAATIAGLILMLLPLAGLVWIVSPFSEREPSFVNFMVQADCREQIEPVLHMAIPAAGDPDDDLAGPSSEMLLAIQLFDTLGDGSDAICSHLWVFSDRELINPRLVVGSAPSEETAAAASTHWFYIDPDRNHHARPAAVSADSNGWSINLRDDALNGFVGALMFELADALERTGPSTSRFSMTTVVQSNSFAGDDEIQVGVALTLPPDHRLLQDLSIPGPANVLPTNRGPRYEFSLVESLLGNAANRSHWTSLQAVMQNVGRAQWQEYLVFIFSGLFGFAVGLFFESLFARRNRGR